MENKTIDQKKYLQKYLNPKSKKKKSKKPATGQKRVNIIDDDVDFSQLMPVDESEIDLYATGEDAPQIAGIIDERPIEVRLKEKFKFSQWKVINEDDGFDSRLVVKEYDKSTGKEKTVDTDLSRENSRSEPENKDTTKLSADSDDDLEVPRKRKRNDSDNDLPRRGNERIDLRTDSDEDLELPRKNSDKGSTKIKKPEKYERSRSSDPDSDLELSRNSRRRHSDSDDLELPRKGKRKSTYSKSDNLELNIKKESTKEKKKKKEINSQKVIEIKSETNSSSEPSSSNTKNIVKFNIRNPDKEKQKVDAERNQEQKEKYEIWGRGLKQVSDKQQKLENEAREMAKPLARYADDEDLENFLKEQEREGDPMLEYIRKENKGKNSQKSNEPSKPKYEGAYMPNRFGIAPGYRWDGVDRSNGYEANWFKVQNSKKIMEEEAYKWSVDDM